MSNILFQLSDANSNKKVTLTTSNNEEEVMGGIILNRIAGIAFDKIDLNSLNKECQKILKVIRMHYEDQYDKFIKKLKFTADMLMEADFKFAFLKGSYLTPVLYKRGQRTSNDIDLLINASDISKMQEILRKNGFVQGHCDSNGNIIAASRWEIIESKMNYGETIPFLRYLDQDLLEIDLNFSVDYKAKGVENIVSNLLNNVQKVQINGLNIQTLSDVDFLIHLCCHLFKEATTYEWLEHRRDLMLYKFSDINVFLHRHGCEEFFYKLQDRTKELNVEKACYYTFINSAVIYPSIKEIVGFDNMLNVIKPESTEYLNQIIYAKTKKTYYHEMTFEQWFSCEDRVSALKDME